MNDSNSHRARLLAHLSGNLSEADRESLERAALTEPDSFDALDAAETELVEAWVRGELAGEEEKIVGAAIARSPRLQESVELVAALDLRSRFRPDSSPKASKPDVVLIKAGLGAALFSLLAVILLSWNLVSTRAEIERQQQILQSLEQRALQATQELEELRQDLARLEAEARLRARRDPAQP